MATRPKAVIESRNGEKFSPITIAKNVLTDDGQNLHDILSDRKEDMMTPTIENSSSMFKVGQGDNVDFSDNVMNGAYEDVVLKGKSLVNVIQEPSSQDVVLPYEFEDGQYVTINDTKEGGALGVELKGQTLVNIAKKQEKPFSHSADKVLQNNHLQLSHSLKANTTYTRYIHVSALDLGTTSNVVMYDALYGEDGSYSQYSYVVTSKGWIINTFTPKTTSINPYMINPDMNALSNGLIYIEIDKFMIIEGDYTNVDIPYFEGMQSVKMPVLTTIGKNLLPYNEMFVSSFTSTIIKYFVDGFNISDFEWKYLA